MNESIYHLIAFIAALAALTVLIVSGHGSDPTLTAIISGIVGGSGITSLGKIGKDFFETSIPAAKPSNSQRGFSRLPLLVGMLAIALVSCAVLKQPAQTQTQTIETGCAATAAALESLAMVQATLPLPSADTQAISRAVQVVQPICTSSTPPTYATVQSQAMADAVTVLTTEAAKYATAAGH